MHVGEISFCDKIAFNIKSEDTKKYILNNLEKKYNIKIIHKHHDKFDTRSINVLSSNPHLVCVRSNGNPYFLYLMKYNFIQYCVFIDKKIQQGYYLPRMIIVQLMIDDSLFTDTVLDGEMIKCNDNKWYYLCNDMLVCKGLHLQDMNHPKRISLLYDVLDKHYINEEYDPFKIGVKSFFKYNELQQMLEDYIPSLPYTTRGVYFKPLYLKFKDILYNFDDNLIKKVERIKYKDVKQFILMNDNIKDGNNSTSTSNSNSTSNSGTCTPLPVPVPTSTKVFSVRKTSTPDVYDLFEGNNNIGIACVPTLKISKKMREITKDMNMVDRIDIPFEYSEKFKKWLPCM